VTLYGTRIRAGVRELNAIIDNVAQPARWRTRPRRSVVPHGLSGPVRWIGRRRLGDGDRLSPADAFQGTLRAPAQGSLSGRLRTAGSSTATERSARPGGRRRVPETGERYVLQAFAARGLVGGRHDLDEVADPRVTRDVSSPADQQPAEGPAASRHHADRPNAAGTVRTAGTARGRRSADRHDRDRGDPDPPSTGCLTTPRLSDEGESSLAGASEFEYGVDEGGPVRMTDQFRALRVQVGPQQLGGVLPDAVCGRLSGCHEHHMPGRSSAGRPTDGRGDPLPPVRDGSRPSLSYPCVEEDARHRGPTRSA